MKVQYTGMHDEVIVSEILDPNTGIPRTIARGESIEVDDALGERMLEQRANWRVSAGGKIRDYVDIAADVRALEAAEAGPAAAEPEADVEPSTLADSDTGDTTAEG